MTAYSYEKFVKDIYSIGDDIQNEEFDAIVAISRGGVTFGHFLSQRINQRNLYIINSIHYDDQQKLDTIEIFNTPDLRDFKKIVVVDDIVDSGETINAVIKHLQNEFNHLEIKSASIFYKKSASHRPNYWLHEANDWIDFFWDKDTR